MHVRQVLYPLNYTPSLNAGVLVSTCDFRAWDTEETE